MSASIDPTGFKDLICFWDFQEPAGSERIAKGPFPYRLRENQGPIERIDGGLFGSHALRLTSGQWLHIPRSECPALNCSGRDAQVTVVAWLKRARQRPEHCEAVAGMWNETTATRQYCLFLNLHIWESRDQVCGHISSVGGPTPGYKYAMDVAVGATTVPFDVLQTVGFTYDSVDARAYLNGRLDVRSKFNPFPFPVGLFDGGENGSDFTVGAVDRSGEMGNWFAGDLHGLAVFGRALSEKEMKELGSI